ncbi:MAG TPA: BTAD domain-containing putative transcriptional regulator [Acidimicrobiales bacterium]|nr:BTAD domain-containing putative transcriptional regulator [Acidimicrobiales bacterium]
MPQYHVPRRRLTERCTGEHVVVVEAAGGYGKSVLGAELVGSWWSVGINVQLDHRDAAANLLAARLRAAVMQAGFTDAALAAESGSDATVTCDAVVSALAKERCTFVIDDAHHAAPDAAALIEHLASRLEGEQHLVVLARELPRGAERLRRAEYFHLGASDLAFDAGETLQLCRSGFGLRTTSEGASVVARLTGGWTAATVLAVAQAARTGEAAEAVATARIAPGNPAAAVAAILEEPVAALGAADRRALAQVARLPLLDRALVDLALGDPGFFERSLAAGLPFSPSAGPWSELPGPVRDHLATFAPLDRAVMRTAAEEYSRRGELGAALELLLDSGDPGEAAAILARTSPEDAESLDALELQAVFDRLPSDVVDANPSILVLVARVLGVAYQYGQRTALFERAGEVAARTGDATLARAVAAERANDLCLHQAYEECIGAAHEVLDAAAPDELLTRARCHYALARALWLGPYIGQRDRAALAESEASFRRAADLYRALGMRSALAPVLVEKANLIDFDDGRASAALALLDEALALVVDRPRRWAYVQSFRAKVAADLGLDEVCRASVEEVFRVAEQFGDEIFHAYGHWRLATLSSYRGDAEATMHHVRQTELHRSDRWWGQISTAFLAGAADCLDRVGHTTSAWEYLERARSDPKDGTFLVLLTQAVLEARHGDPALAERRLVDVVERQHLDRREAWRVTLLRAFAAFRLGNHHLAGAMAARSFEEAARIGQPHLPLICERTVTEQLIALAVATGEPAAVALEASTLPLSLTLLGRFALSEAGRAVQLGVSQEAKLLKLVALRGRVHAEQAIATLWPDASAAAGRNRLRTVTSRLKAVAGDVLVRHGDTLALHEAVRVDLHDFLAEARRAQALATTDLVLATAVARGAIARYRGEVLSDDPYEDWVEQPRQHARQVVLDLLDLCASEAAQRGDLDALRRAVERTIELDPYDDSRYLRAASTLLEQGRRVEALTVVRRARSAYAELGLDPPRPLLDLERQIVA